MKETYDETQNMSAEERGYKAGPPPLFKAIGGPAKATVKAPQMAARFNVGSKAASLVGLGGKGSKAKKAANVARRVPKGPASKVTNLSKYTGKNVDMIPRGASLIGPAAGEDPISKATGADGIGIEDGDLTYDGPDKPSDWDTPSPGVDIDVPVFGQITTALYALVALAVIYILGQLFNVNVG